ncbi:MAG: metallophosphoesterase [Firmicutes bacterium]|nr:metallophosphoesterase [Bacillota bacterium]
MRIGVVSDIHGSYEHLLRAVEAMEPIELLLHAGDGWADLVRWRREHPAVPVEMVVGNCDFPPVNAGYSVELVLNLANKKVLLTHGHLFGAKTDLHRLARRGREIGADLVVFGHTHRPVVLRWGEILLFNPGALSAARCYGRPSYGLLEISPDGTIRTGHGYL